MAIDYSKFGAYIKEKRNQMGFTQEHVASYAGISVETQRLIENGRREPRVITLERLSEIYKTDLIYVLSQSRVDYDFFSDTFIERINSSLNNFDYIEFIDHINELIAIIKNEYTNDKKKNHRNSRYINYLETFKNVRFDDVRYKENNSIAIEQVLEFLSITGKDPLIDPSLYYIELQMGITLAVLLRKTNQFDRSKEFLHLIIDSLENERYLTQRQSDYLVVAYFNLSYIYHRLDEHEKVIEIIDSVLLEENLHLKRIAISDFLIRKAIAQFHLGNENYKHLYATALTMENVTRVGNIQERLFDMYGIDPAKFMNMDDIPGFKKKK